MAIKNLFLFLFILALSCNISYAQNSVTVEQKGNSNKTTIIQGDVQSSKQGVDTPCDEKSKKSGQSNSLTVKSNGKTVIDTNSISANKYRGIIGDKHELSAFQYGRGNNLSLLLPDSAGLGSGVVAYQNGSGNMISAILDRSQQRLNLAQSGSGNMLSGILNSSHQNLNLSQNGTGNSIAINPCGSKTDTGNGSASNSATVSMKGDGNTVHINQQ